MWTNIFRKRSDCKLSDVRRRQFFLHYNFDFSHICLKCLLFEFLSLVFRFLILSLDVAKNACKPFYLFSVIWSLISWRLGVKRFISPCKAISCCGDKIVIILMPCFLLFNLRNYSRMSICSNSQSVDMRYRTSQQAIQRLPFFHFFSKFPEITRPK